MATQKQVEKIMQKLGKQPKFLTLIQKDICLLDARRANMISREEYCKRADGRNINLDGLDMTKYVYGYDGKLHWRN